MVVAVIRWRWKIAASLRVYIEREDFAGAARSSTDHGGGNLSRPPITETSTAHDYALPFRDAAD